ncbi:MAG: Bax inhibitor-1/YccA family protein [Bacteroidota bacterium]
MRSSNPTLGQNTFTKTIAEEGAERMTLQGAVNKTFILLGLVLLTSIISWNYILTTADGALAMPLMMGGAIGGLIFALVTTFKPQWSAITAPVYALLEGLFLGTISAFYESQFPGIVLQAVLLTMGTLLCLLVAYRTGLIKATENFKLGVFAATGAIATVYLISFILSFFGVHMAFLHDSGPLGIGLSIFVVIIAALNLVLDFDFIENGAESGAPKYMEWYAAFGLMVTLIWLYLEFLRLLAKLNRR